MRYMIFDRWGNPLGDLPYAIKAIRTRATDGTDTLDITTIGEINKDERIVFKDSMGRWAEYLCQSTQTAHRVPSRALARQALAFALRLRLSSI